LRLRLESYAPQSAEVQSLIEETFGTALTKSARESVQYGVSLNASVEGIYRRLSPNGQSSGLSVVYLRGRDLIAHAHAEPQDVCKGGDPVAPPSLVQAYLERLLRL